MGKAGLYLSGIFLIIYGLIEIAPALLLVKGKKDKINNMAKFIFKPLQQNPEVTYILGIVFGVIRITAGIGIIMNLMWGLLLGIIVCVVTFNIMTIYLPAGIFDGMISSIILIILLITYFGSKTII